jgi:hypothetical protein
LKEGLQKRGRLAGNFEQKKKVALKATLKRQIKESEICH